jgi:ubiquitin-conjugating enzyme E2 D/E
VVISGVRRRIFSEIRKLERLESENKIIIDINPFKSFGNGKIPPRFNNVTIIEGFPSTSIIEYIKAINMFTFQARILPQTEPYCQASFLIEIVFPSEYPFKQPKIIFSDPIYHPNIYDDYSTFSSDGGFPDDYGWYKPTTSLVEIIEKVLSFIDNIPGRANYVNKKCFKEYEKDYPTFYKKALEGTLSYGRPRY